MGRVILTAPSLEPPTHGHILLYLQLPSRHLQAHVETLEQAWASHPLLLKDKPSFPETDESSSAIINWKLAGRILIMV